jgi:hypothetical protein
MQKIGAPLEFKQAKENWSSLKVQNISPYGSLTLDGTDCNMPLRTDNA